MCVKIVCSTVAASYGLISQVGSVIYEACQEWHNVVRPRTCIWPFATEELPLNQPYMPLQAHSLSAQRRRKQKGSVRVRAYLAAAWLVGRKGSYSPKGGRT